VVRTIDLATSSSVVTPTVSSLSLAPGDHYIRPVIDAGRSTWTIGSEPRSCGAHPPSCLD